MTDRFALTHAATSRIAFRAPFSGSKRRAHLQLHLLRLYVVNYKPQDAAAVGQALC